MDIKEALELAQKARALGYSATIKMLINASYRVYLTREDGKWTFLVDEEDLNEVHQDDALWMEDCGL